MAEDGACTDCGGDADGHAGAFDLTSTPAIRGEIELEGPILVPSDGVDYVPPRDRFTPPSPVNPELAHSSATPVSQWLEGARGQIDRGAVDVRRTDLHVHSLMTLDGRVAGYESKLSQIAFQEAGDQKLPNEGDKAYSGADHSSNDACRWVHSEFVGRKYEVEPVRGMERHILFHLFGVPLPNLADWRLRKLEERRRAILRQTVPRLLEVRNLVEASKADQLAMRMEEQIGPTLRARCDDPCYLTGPTGRIEYGPLVVRPQFWTRLDGPIAAPHGLGLLYVLEIHYEIKASGSWTADFKWDCA